MRRWGPEGHLVEWAFRPAAPDSMNCLEEERGFPGLGILFPKQGSPLQLRRRQRPERRQAQEELFSRWSHPHSAPLRV